MQAENKQLFLPEEAHRNFRIVGMIVIVPMMLYVISLFSYLVFHSLVEIITVAIGFALFIIVWNSRSYLPSDNLKILGIGFGFVALIDLLHTLAYKGMGVFPGYGANLPTQLWIVARYIQAATLCIAPLFVRRRINEYFVFGAYFAAASIAILAFSGHFPDCYVEGIGLTPFKIVSEYVITCMLIVSLAFFYMTRDSLSGNVYALISFSIICMAASELAFTTYLNVYGFANMLGHLLKLAAFYLIYRALIVTGLKEPFDIIFRDLKQKGTILQEANDILEKMVDDRTQELRESEAALKEAQHLAHIGNWEWDASKGTMWWSEECYRIFNLDLNASPPNYENHLKMYTQESTAMLDAEVKNSLQTHEPFEIDLELADPSSPTRWISMRAQVNRKEDGSIAGLRGTAQNITERKHAERALHHLNRELRAISNCNQVMVRATDEEALLNDICRIICEEAGYRMAWVGYPENDEARTVRPIAWGGVEDGYLKQAAITWAETERGRGPTGTTIRTGEISCIQDFAIDTNAAPWRESALKRGYRSAVALPLKDENEKTFGVLRIYSERPNTFTPDEIRLLEELSGDLAFGVITLRARADRWRAEKERIAHLSFLERMDRVNRAIQGTNNPEQMLSDVLDVVLSIFDCDRAYLLYPCNPDADSWTCQMERTKPEYPGVLSVRMQVPMDPEVADGWRILLGLDRPMKVGPGNEYPMPASITENFGVKCTMTLALRPKLGEPWQLGINQCSNERIWTPEEERLLQEIGRRLTDGLTVMIAYRNLRDSEEKFRNISLLAQNAFIIMDNDGTISFWNKAAEKIFGYSQDETIGKELHTLIVPPEVAREYENGLARFRSTGQGPVIGKTLELSAVRKDGTRFPIELSIASLLIKDQWCATGIIRDITGRKKAELDREDALRQRDLILKSAGDGIIGIDTQGCITFINPSATSMLGYDAEELLGRNSHSIYHHTRSDGTPYPEKECQIYGAFKDGEVHNMQDDIFW
ncbi:MAG TPA: MASE3 domain-containing protein, partial [Dissulfurispiraceae bacterium]|nr:MASE3 domain-containing protein [Dissulfurispiraceae bacterium]